MTLVFSTTAYEPLADAVREAGALEAGRIHREPFPDGERDLRIACAVSGRDAVLVGGTISDADTLEVFDLACGLVDAGAETLTLVIPFFGYSTMERATAPGQVVTAKTRARLLSTIPRARAGNRAVLLELHSDGLPYYFEGGLHPRHVSADPVVQEAVRAAGGASYVLASADAGRAKHVQSLANALGVPAAVVLKRRVDARRTELVAVSADVAGQTVVIYDDMVRTGGSLLGAARAYRTAGAARVSAVVTHGVLPDGALDALRADGSLDALTCTDSHPRARACADGVFLRVVSVAPLLADAVRALA
jgi:ribose-phosphate pyrophosphokinase